MGWGVFIFFTIYFRWLLRLTSLVLCADSSVATSANKFDPSSASCRENRRFDGSPIEVISTSAASADPIIMHGLLTLEFASESNVRWRMLTWLLSLGKRTSRLFADILLNLLRLSIFSIFCQTEDFRNFLSSAYAPRRTMANPISRIAFIVKTNAVMKEFMPLDLGPDW